MRLRVQSSKRLTKTDKQKKANKEKKAKGPKINKNYMSMKPYPSSIAKIDLTKLTYGIINSSDLISVELPDGAIVLENSWLEFILITLSAIISEQPDKFKKLFEENEVTSQTFIVDKVYGKYTFDANLWYKAYNIYGSGYYLEAVFNNSNLFSAIIGLSKCIGVALDEVQLNIRQKGFKPQELNFDELEETETVVEISKCRSMFSGGYHLVSASIMEDDFIAHRIDVVLLGFCNLVYDKYGMLSMTKLPQHDNTGVTMQTEYEADADESGVETPDNRMYTPIRGSMFNVYTDGDIDGIIDFITESMDILCINKSDFKLKFRGLKSKDKLKEWEID